MQLKFCLISLILMSCSSIDKSLNEKGIILDKFYSTNKYGEYTQNPPITRQVITPVYIKNLNINIEFPNPYVASLFKEFCRDELSLSCS